MSLRNLNEWYDNENIVIEALKERKDIAIIMKIIFMNIN